MRRFFTSDPHFGHSNIIRYSGRPFADCHKMNLQLIKNWKYYIKDDDEVWVLGDVCFKQGHARINQYLDQLPGRLHLVAGNHDKKSTRNNARWLSVTESVTLGPRCGSPYLILTHRRCEREIPDGCVNLHGHSHGRLYPTAKYCDVGMDVFGYRPVEWTQIKEMIDIWTDFR